LEHLHRQLPVVATWKNALMRGPAGEIVAKI
jgi:hypothetical protein